MIHVFHGFLGSPADFSYLKAENIQLHDLYLLDHEIKVSEDDVLIGYSMGGRVALEIAAQNNFRLKKLVLINAHPGLESDEERFMRTEFETKVMQELTTKTQEDFLAWWNELPIFTHDRPLTISDESRFKMAPELFWRYRLSQQSNYLPLLQEHKEKILYIAGLFDEKYMDLVSEVLLPLEIEVKGIPGGHRLHQEERELMRVLKEAKIL